MTKERYKVGVGIILAAFTLMYAAFTVVANVFAFTLATPTDSYGTTRDVLQLASVIMDVAAFNFAVFAVCWNVRAHKGWRETTSIRFFWWLCLDAAVMFLLPPSLSWDTSNAFTPGFAFMSFTPVLAPVVLMLAAAIVMLDIIKQKNGGTLRKRR